MAFYDRIALARLLAEAPQVGDLNTATVVVDEAKFLQALGYSGNMGPLDAEHLRKKFLSEFHRIIAGQISRPQQPTGQPGFNLMSCVARCRLLGLYEQDLFMPNEGRAKGVALLGGFAEWRDLHHRGGAGKLNYSLVQ